MIIDIIDRLMNADMNDRVRFGIAHRRLPGRWNGVIDTRGADAGRTMLRRQQRSNNAVGAGTGTG